MRVAALLTGRGNNTLKDKNILKVLGKPLLHYPAMAAKRVPEIESFYVSSDCEKILSAAESVGYSRIMRPAELASPAAKHIDAIFHGLEAIKSVDGFTPDILVVMLANSATIKSQWIQFSIQQIVDSPDISAVVPVYKEQDHHPFRAKRINSNGFLEPYFDFSDKEVSTNRQELCDNYFLCHNFWVLNVNKSIYCDKGQKPWVFMGENVQPLIVEKCLDVHTADDLKITEKWLLANRITGDING